MQKIDIHLHLRENAKSGQQENAKMKVSSGEEMAPHLLELGINHGILMSSGENPAGMPFGTNESNRLLCEQQPEYYHWMCSLDEKDMDTVYARLALYKSQGAVGVGELMINKRLDHPFLQEVFWSAQELDLPVLFHMSPEEGFSYGVVDEPGLPLLEGVLKKYPRLRIIGHSQPFWHEISKDAAPDRESRNSWGKGPVVPGGRLVELFSSYPNLYGDLSANSGGCAMMRDPDFGLDFLEQFADRLLFATDMVNTDMVFPLGGWLDCQAQAGRLSMKAYERICRKNAMELFGIQ